MIIFELILYPQKKLYIACREWDIYKTLNEHLNKIFGNPV